MAIFWATNVQANYQEAQAFFRAGRFVESAAAFSQSYTAPRDAAEKLKAEWGLAQSLQRLGFYYSASKYYSVIVRRGPAQGNAFFTNAMTELGKINNSVSLGQSHIVQLFKTKIDPAAIPGPARGFYFYYLGIEAFNRQRFEEADADFRRVPSGTTYHPKAVFHQAVIANLSGRHSEAARLFESIRSTGDKDDEDGAAFREQANLNIARVYYETERYREAITYFAQIPRESDNWLEAHFEAAWAFFLMSKHNNTLGNIHTIHSPFFENRFFPESYILQSITYLRLCRYSKVKESLANFRNRYKPVFQDVRAMLESYQQNPKGFFRLVYDYRVGSLDKYKNAWAILDAVSRTDIYREAGNTIRFSDTEISRLSRMGAKWNSVGLTEELKSFLNKKKVAAVNDAGRRLYDKASKFYDYLKELSDQTQLINAEMVLGRVDELRAKLKVGTADKKANFIGGLAPLQVGQDLEFWPFEQEYWEDELGYYVYNIDSKCGTGAEGGEKGGAEGSKGGDK